MKTAKEYFDSQINFSRFDVIGFVNAYADYYHKEKMKEIDINQPEEKSYPGSFIQWLNFSEPIQFYANTETGLYDDFYSVIGNGKLTIDEIYTYWREKVNGKY